MDNIYRGEPIAKEAFISRLDELKLRLEADLQLEPLPPEVVIEAAHALSKEIDREAKQKIS